MRKNLLKKCISITLCVALVLGNIQMNSVNVKGYFGYSASDPCLQWTLDRNGCRSLYHYVPADVKGDAQRWLNFVWFAEDFYYEEGPGGEYGARILLEEYDAEGGIVFDTPYHFDNTTKKMVPCNKAIVKKRDVNINVNQNDLVVHEESAPGANDAYIEGVTSDMEYTTYIPRISELETGKTEWTPVTGNSITGLKSGDEVYIRYSGTETKTPSPNAVFLEIPVANPPITDEERETVDWKEYIGAENIGAAIATKYKNGLLEISGTGAITKITHNNIRTITEVVISDGITNIPEDMFEGCYDIQKVTLGKDLTSIGEDAFEYTMYAFDTLIVKFSNPSQCSGVDNIPNHSEVSIIVPEGSKTAFKNSIRWKDFLYGEKVSFDTVKNKLQENYYWLDNDDNEYRVGQWFNGTIFTWNNYDLNRNTYSLVKDDNEYELSFYKYPYEFLINFAVSDEDSRVEKIDVNRIKSSYSGKDVTTDNCELYVEPTAITFEEEEYEICVGDTMDLPKSICTPNDATLLDVKYIEDTYANVINIRDNKIEALREGEATITAEYEVYHEGDYDTLSTTCKITVVKKPILPTEIKFEEDGLKVFEGRSIALPDVKATFASEEDENSFDYSKDLEWSIEDETVAKIEGETIVGLKTGKTTLTATSKADAKIYATCEIEVVDSANLVSSIIVNTTSVYVGETKQLDVTVGPENAENKKLKYEVLSGGITIDEDGMIHAGQAIATIPCLIRVSATDGSGVSQEATIEVKNPTREIIIPVPGTEAQVENYPLGGDAGLVKKYKNQITVLYNDTTKEAIIKSIVLDNTTFAGKEITIPATVNVGNKTVAITKIGDGKTCAINSKPYVSSVIGGMKVYSTDFNATTLIIPEGIETIAPNAIDASELESITLPASLSSIDNAAFTNVSETVKISAPKDSYAAKTLADKGYVVEETDKPTSGDDKPVSVDDKPVGADDKPAVGTTQTPAVGTTQAPAGQATTTEANSSTEQEVTVPKVTGVKLVAKKKALQLKWKKLSGITKIEIQYGLKKNFKKANTVKLAKSKTSYTMKKLKSKKKYYVRIRAIKGTKVGAWVSVNKKVK